MTREEIIAMSEEDVRKWLSEVEIGSEEHIRRHNLVYYDYGLSRLGIQLEPTRSGELKIESI